MPLFCPPLVDVRLNVPIPAQDAESVETGVRHED